MVRDDFEIGIALADERECHDMTQETLAAEMRRHGAPHMTRTMIGRIEAGQRKLSARELGAAALALHTNPCEIIMPGAKVRPVPEAAGAPSDAAGFSVGVHLGIGFKVGERVHWPDDEADEGVVLCEGGAWFVRWDRRQEDTEEADTSPINPGTGRLLDFDRRTVALYVRRVQP